MAEGRTPAVFSIPVNTPFADALVARLLAEHGEDRLALARGLILVPNNRAGIAIRDAFVRQAERGLLLPRLVAIGDADLDERAGAALDTIDDEAIPPAVDPLARQIALARLLQDDGTRDVAEAMRLAADLARALDQLTVEEKTARDLETLELPEGLSRHWEDALLRMKAVLETWPALLSARGVIDLAERRNRLLNRVAQRWRDAPPSGFVVAAGISTSAPAVARLLRTAALLPRGSVILAGLDWNLPEDDWAALGDADGPESHPQQHLRRLLDQMGVARAEVAPWVVSPKGDAAAQALSDVFALPERTKAWSDRKGKSALSKTVKALELATPAEEAQAIALAIREALETPGKTVALVTPDRDLATRVSGHLGRWGITADDSAGRALTATPPGSMLLAVAMAAAEDFAPAALVALLKHPLVQAGERRAAWLDGARLLDLALRGPRPAPGLSGVAAFLAQGDKRVERLRADAGIWWLTAEPLLAPLEARPDGLPAVIATLRQVAESLCGDAVWSGVDGRAAAQLLLDLELAAGDGPRLDGWSSIPQLLRQLMDGIAIRPGFGGHPRVSIWGLIEARLQTADLMILGGLNEGVWPQLSAPDPWLAPAVRRALGLPGLERRIGLAAHDLASGMGASDVILTRARRDARGPALPSRFWLRIEALTGGLSEPDIRHDLLAPYLDGLRGRKPDRAARPRQRPSGPRPTTVAVTDVDRLAADPYAFYAKKMLRLGELDGLDADPGPAWRGSLIHEVLRQWAIEDDYAPGRLVERMEKALDEEAVHPLIRALWLPRLTEAAEWIEAEIVENREARREPILAEEWGSVEIDGITLGGRADRIDRLRDGSLAIVDYKTGKAPSNAQVGSGFALQLGLIGLIAEQGGYREQGAARGFEYWSLARDSKSREYGKRSSPVEGRSKAKEPDEFVAFTASEFAKAARSYLLGEEPFVAKLAPQFAYGEYDHLMRLEEWEGRDA